MPARFGFAHRLSLFYGALFAIYGIATPYLSVWFAYRGLTIAEIATVSAVGPLVRMVCGPVLSFAADRWNLHVRLLAICAWGSLLAWLALSMASSVGGAMVGMTLVAMSGAALNPLLDTIAMYGVRTRGADYGIMRAWGSVAFIVAALASGLMVDWLGAGVAMHMLVLAAASTALASLLLPRVKTVQAGALRKTLRIGDAMALVRKPALLLFLLSAGTVQGSHAVLNVYSVIHWQSLGLSNPWCGALWAIGITAEIALFLAAGRLLPRVGAVALMLIGGVIATVRWIMMAFDPPLALLLPLQVAHGLTFGASHLGAMQFLARAIPEEQAATAQGLYALMAGGLMMAVSTQIAGMAYASIGGRAYATMALFAGVSVVAAMLLCRNWDGQRLSIGEKRIDRDRRA